MRVDPLSGAHVRIVPSREGRPNQPSGACPFCVGGLEAPDPYLVRAFPNRWPALADGCCEVVLYGPEHDGTLASLGVERARGVVDLWAERTLALGGREGIAYVLVFENHGPDVGATIAHPHGQIYAYTTVPPTAQRRLAHLADGGSPLELDPDGCRTVVDRRGWRAWVPFAATYPLHVRLAPVERRPDLAGLTDEERNAFADVLVELLGRVQTRYPSPAPYMFWIHQAPTDGRTHEQAWLHLELVSPWRAEGVSRHLAAAEVGSEVYLNPVDPAEAARSLREVDLDKSLRAT